jgi:hypothetical protein
MLPMARVTSPLLPRMQHRDPSTTLQHAATVIRAMSTSKVVDDVDGMCTSGVEDRTTQPTAVTRTRIRDSRMLLLLATPTAGSPPGTNGIRSRQHTAKVVTGATTDGNTKTARLVPATADTAMTTLHTLRLGLDITATRWTRSGETMTGGMDMRSLRPCGPQTPTEILIRMAHTMRLHILMILIFLIGQRKTEIGGLTTDRVMQTEDGLDVCASPHFLCPRTVYMLGVMLIWRPCQCIYFAFP